MKRLLAIGIILLFIGMTISSSTGLYLNEQSIKTLSFGNILYVGGNGTGNYSKIQDAIDNASDGDTVFVFDDSSPYYENVVVDKSINLTGENKETTIVDGQSNGNVMNITADYVKISKFTLQNNRDDYYSAGIYIQSNSTLITDNILTENYNHGLYIEDGHDNTIIKNTITKNERYGIVVQRKADKNLITQNTITNQDGGICLSRTTQNIISENNISNNNLGIYFYSMGTGADNNNNTVTRNKISNNGDGITLVGGKDNTISYNCISYNTKNGISGRLYYYNIHHNSITNNGDGLDITGNNNVINKNNIESNYRCIKLGLSFNNEITSNNFIDNTRNVDSYDECTNKWDKNYWNRPRLLPMMILEWKLVWIIQPRHAFPGVSIEFRWPTFDWHPALIPYDIGA